MSFRNYYDTPSYGRSRDTGRSSATAERPTTVTAKYLNTTPSYKSSSIPILSSDRSTKEDTPISTIANRYANYNKSEKPVSKYDAYNTSKIEKPNTKYGAYDTSKTEKSASKYDTYSSTRTDKPVSKYDAYSTSKIEKPTSKYEKKDFTKLTVPSITTNKSRDVSPISTSKFNLSRPSRQLSPERRTTKSFKDKSRDPSPGDHDKDIPSKTDKSSGYNSLSNYKLYPRTSNYTRPASRAEAKPEITVNRYAIANRLSSNYLRSPPTVKRTSVSPVNHTDSIKNETEKCVSQPSVVEKIKEQNEPVIANSENNISNDTHVAENETETVTIVTRHTSPTPPGSSAYVRSRRADMAKTIEKSFTRPKKRPEMLDKEIQSDRLDDPTRSSRFGSTARTSVTNWSYYTPNSNSYTGYAGRYSTQYSNLRESSGSNSYSASERTGRSQSTEPDKRENSNCNSYPDLNNKDSSVSNHVAGTNEEILSVYTSEPNKGDDTSDIIINVNLKLKRAKSPAASTEQVSPEITITSNQLPPQAPKAEGATKTKKIKVRRTSTDSASDSSSKKKVIKKRSKSVSSTDSDQGSEVCEKGSPPKSLQKKSSNSNSQNGPSKLKHSKSRESASPESSITLSTQSSISEDETVSRSKANEVSRTSADELSIPTDRSGKDPSPISSQKNESGTEEAKSFLIRALAPVTNLFKMRHQGSSDNSRWLENSTSESTGKDVSNITTESDRSSKGKNDTTNIIASNDDNLVKLKAIRPIESGERAWWLDSESEKKSSLQNRENQMSSSEKNIPRKIRHVESGEKAWWLESNSESKQENETSRENTSEISNLNKPLKKCKFADDEKPWWLDSCANIPEGIERLSPPRKSSSDSEKSEKFNFFKVRHVESGDQKDWWATSNENSTNNMKAEQNQSKSASLSKSGSERSFPLRRIRHIESGERPWWLASDKNIPEGIEKLPTPPPNEESDSSDSEVQIYVPPTHIPPFPLNLPDDEPLGARRSPEGLETPKENEDYRGRTSPYENNRQFRRPLANSYQKGVNKYISRCTDIDDILGTSGQIYSPFMDSILARRTGQIPFDDDACEEIDPTQVRIHDSTAQRPVIKKIHSRSNIIDYRDEDQLDDATLQVFKDGDYGPYLDLDSTLGEQDEELEGLQDSRKNALVLRTQLSVRVHAIIERLLHSQGRELRRALFTLKQILQSDKDLVHEFVANKGLDCLMQVGNMADHNYLDYILRALGQILLYVDGMHGVMAHKRCIQWLYSLIASKFRHVVKTALKLLLVFVEYTEKNCLLLIDAIISVDGSNGRQPWYNIMKILQDFDASDTELLIYATTLINRCLNNVPDRDTYYDQVDALQDQGIDDIIQLYMSKQGTDLDLLRQLQIFEAVLLYEDGDDTGTALKQLDDSVINSIRRRSINLSSERRKSKKQQCKEKAKPVITHTEPETKIPNTLRSSFLPSIIDNNKENKELTTALRRRRDRFARQAHHIIQQQEMLNHSSDIYSGLFPNPNDSFTNTNGSFANTNGNYSTPNGSFTTPNGSFSNLNGSFTSANGNFTNTNGSFANTNGNYSTPNGSYTSPNGSFSSLNGSFTSPNGSLTSVNESFTSANGSFTSKNLSFPSLIGNYTNTNFTGTIGNYSNGTYSNNKSYSSVNGNVSSQLNGVNGQQEDENYINRTTKNFNLADVLKNGNQRYTSGLKQRIQNGTLGHSVNAVDAITVMRQKQIDTTPEVKDDRGILLNREHSIKDLAQRLTSPVSPSTEEKPLRVSDMAGIVSKAKEELAKSQSKEIIKSPSIEKSSKVHEIKVSENDLHWEELRKGCLHREFHLCDLDFSDLREDSDDDMSSPAVNAASGPPPPPPTMFPPMGIPPPLPGYFPLLTKNNVPAPPKSAMYSENTNDSDTSTIKKNKKTVKLFWKEIQENPTPVAIRPKVGGFIWDDLPDVNVDTAMLEHLFESRTNDLIIKKLMEPKRNLILDAKRSNAINIAMKKLPTPQTIKAAIMKMDATVIGREGIEKLLTMLPTEEEKIKIQEAQYANPDLPLGSAEQFLLTLASINELSSRLKLWVFKLDFDNLEKEIAEPLMDLKQGIELLKVNRTFKVILSTLRTVGNHLNGNYAKGFRLEYLSKVVEVKDTVHKHPLLYHICEMIIEKFPDSSDFFSEVGPVIRASKVDFDVLSANLQKLESDCKASWDHMKRVAKHDGSQIFKTKINEFLKDAAERIILLSIVKKRVMSRFNKGLLFLGVPPCDIHKTKPAEFLKVIAEFSLEYRTTRERVLQQLEKKANHRERNKTRGKMIIDVGNYSHKNGDHTADNALKELLKTDPDTDSLTEGRRKFQTNNRKILVNGDLSADDEILESLVRSATSKRKPVARERRRNRISDRKNLNRTLDGNQS